MALATVNNIGPLLLTTRFAAVDLRPPGCADYSFCLCLPRCGIITRNLEMVFRISSYDLPMIYLGSGIFA